MNTHIQNAEELDEPIDLCHWCNEIYPISNMRIEKDFGYLCHRCIKAILSRGEELEFDDTDN